MVKIGDTVVSVSDEDIDIAIGNEYVVTDVSELTISFRDDGGDRRKRLLCDYRVIHTHPPQKIQQNGYEYELVGPVKPDWLVDGAWVVSKGTGNKYKVKEVGNNTFRAENEDGSFNSGAVSSSQFSEFYRPHTPEDFKWGDWAMYEGKRVFVIADSDEHGSIPVSYPDIYPLGYNETQRSFLSVSGKTLTPTF